MKEYAAQSSVDFGELDLFAAATRARASDPATSRAAARSLDTRTILGQLCAAYADAGAVGLTDEEAGARIGKPGAWKRCSDLRRLGYIVATGETRTGSSGRKAIVCRWQGDAT
ncbi:MAG: hypothetical protein NTZ29_15815 [Verrucomicrobia bacterium]|nr:hypothetical protein [Verrucomicrobiota bacterium]